MATRVVSGVLREVWQEATPLAGGAAQVLPTGVRVSARNISRLLAMLHITPVLGLPRVTATVAPVNGFAVFTITNVAPAGNTATFILDVTHLQSPQQGADGTAAVVHVIGGAVATGFALPTTDVDVANYPVVDSDVVLNVRRTATGPAIITLPTIATAARDRIVVVKDTGYNANNNSITVTPTGADKINNVAASYTINLPGTALWLQANRLSSNWEIL
jgi:hypothetical protein